MAVYGLSNQFVMVCYMVYMKILKLTRTYLLHKEDNIC